MAEKSAPHSQPDPGRSPSPKQLAAQARAAAEAAEKRRERTIRIVGAAVVAAVVIALISIGIFAGKSKDGAEAGVTADSNAALPAGVQSDTYGVPVGTGWTAENAAKLPTLEVWEDFQCPGCAEVEKIAGAAVLDLANNAKVKLLMRPTAFLDNNFPQSNDSSARATAAWGCAIDQGQGVAFHSAVFAAQPATEGVGWSEAQLLQLGQAVGLEGSKYDAFAKCVSDGKYLGWAANSTQKFIDAKVGGTPAGLLNGEELSGTELADVAGLTKKIEAATKS